MVADVGLRRQHIAMKLGHMCTATGYRNPVYLAKAAATADIISGGGANGHRGGWYEPEWKAYGYGFPSAGVRLGMLDEGVRIMRDAWRDGRVASKTASTIRSRAPSSRRSRCRTADLRCGSPAAARR